MSENKSITTFGILFSASILISFPYSVLAGNRSPLAFTIPASSQPSIAVAQERSLPSTTTHISQFMGSGGSLTVSNGTGKDAFVKLVEPNSRTLVAAFFVKSGSSSTQQQIPDGTYKVLFVLGNGWNPNTQSFTKGKSFAKFDKALNFMTTQVIGGVQYRTFKITLHSVRNGNTTKSGISEQEFNRY